LVLGFYACCILFWGFMSVYLVLWGLSVFDWVLF